MQPPINSPAKCTVSTLNLSAPGRTSCEHESCTPWFNTCTNTEHTTTTHPQPPSRQQCLRKVVVFLASRGRSGGSLGGTSWIGHRLGLVSVQMKSQLSTLMLGRRPRAYSSFSLMVSSIRVRAKTWNFSNVEEVPACRNESGMNDI